MFSGHPKGYNGCTKKSYPIIKEGVPVTVRERVLAGRLMEKLEGHDEYAEALGVCVTLVQRREAVSHGGAQSDGQEQCIGR